MTLKQTITVTKISSTLIFLHVFTVFTRSECFAELKSYFRLNGHAQCAALKPDAGVLYRKLPDRS